MLQIYYPLRINVSCSRSYLKWVSECDGNSKRLLLLASSHKLKCFCQICEKLSLCYPKFSTSLAHPASLQGKTGLKVLTEPTQTTVYKYFLLKFLIHWKQTQDKCAPWTLEQIWQPIRETSAKGAMGPLKVKSSYSDNNMTMKRILIGKWLVRVGDPFLS